MRESRTSGSVRGASSDRRLYSTLARVRTSRGFRLAIKMLPSVLARLPAKNKTGLSLPAIVPSTHATILRTNSGPSCRSLRMILSLGTKATIFRDVLRHCTMQLRFGSAMLFDN